jgi:phosphoheptose isomerase
VQRKKTIPEKILAKSVAWSTLVGVSTSLGSKKVVSACLEAKSIGETIVTVAVLQHELIGAKALQAVQTNLGGLLT